MIADQPREISNDEACDFVYAAMAYVVDHAPGGVLVLDRDKLSRNLNRKLLIEIGDNFVSFSFPDSSIQ
jgi:hypothetical protein